MTARAAGVGRTEEIAAIRAVVDAACAGSPSFLVIAGEAGIGKTTLLDMALPSGTDPSFAVLRATGDEAETELDFGLIDQLVRGAGVPPPALSELLVDAGTDPLDAGARLLRVFDALELTIPLIITIDDAHLADVASLQALTFAARRLHRDRIALVIAGRPELAHRVPPGLFRLAERSGGVRQLGGLDTHEVAELARRRLASDVPLVAAERLRAHTRGHPLHTRVLLEQLDLADLLGDRALPAPRTFSSLLAAQLADLSDEARRLITALAVLDQPANLAIVVATAALDSADAGVVQLEQAGLAHLERRLDGDRIRLDHAMIGAAILQDLSTTQLRLLHAAAARSTTGAASLSHRVAAAPGPDRELELTLVEAAEPERPRASHRVAGGLFLDAATVAGDLRDRQRYVLRAAHHFMVAGYPLDERFDGLEDFADDAWRSYVVGRMAMAGGQFDVAGPQFEQAWEQLDTTPGSEELRAAIAELRSVIAICTLRPEEVMTWAQRAADSNAGAGLTATMISHGMALAGDLDGAVRVVDRILEGDLDGAQRNDAHLARGIVAVWANDLERARVELSTPIRSRSETLLQAVNARSYLAEAHYRAGRLSEAADLAETTVTLTDDAQTVWLSPLPLGVAAFALAAAGEVERARGHAVAAAELAAMTGQVPAWIWAEHAAMRIADAAHDYAEVVRVGDRMMAEGWDALPEGVHHWRASYVAALIAVGRHVEAESVTEALAREVIRFGDPAIAADAARARCHLSARRDRNGLADADALDVAEQGLSLAERAPRPLDRARLELAAGALLRRGGRRTAASEALTSAHARLEAIGARPWLPSCERELTACGLRPSRRSDPRSADRLTPQEGVIARLVASGHSNRDVAAELFISVKTVEHHLSRIYTKLGVRGRSHLAAVFHEFE